MSDKEEIKKEEKSTPPGRRRYSTSSEKEVKNVKKVIKDIFHYFKKYIPLLATAILFAATSTILSLIGPDKLSQITDLIVDGMNSSIDMNSIKKIAIILASIYIWSRLLSIAQWFIIAIVSTRMSKSLRNDIIKKVDKLPIKFFDKTTTWDILSRITNDAFMMTNSLNHSLTTLVISLITLVWSLILMILTNLIMTITAVGSVAIGVIAIFIIMSRSQKYFDRQQKYLWEVNGHTEEAFSWHTIIKAYNAEEEIKGKFINLNENLRKSTFMAEFLSWITMPIIWFMNNLGFVVVAIVWAILAFKWTITFWVIVAFLVYIRYFTQPLTQIASLAQRLQLALAAWERVFSFLREKEMENEKAKEENNKFTKWDIKFSHVKFWYEENKIIIKDLNLKVKAWEKVAIVWPTWAWKTTIVNLLMRFHEIHSWEIYIDWINTKDMTRNYIHTLFCMVLQDSWVFEGTVKENIIYNRENITESEIEDACKAVWLHHFILTLPKGYDTILDEKISLSMWQKQQLTIARAMVSKSPMLILDEATSSIDTRTEKYIQNAMDQLMKNRTSFIIAHRLSTIKNADLILVLKDWDIIESWNHEQLMKLNWFYTELYNSQFSEE